VADNAQPERQAIAAALQKSEERLRRVVESAPNAMVMINANGKIDMVNTQAERLFGYNRAQMLGQSVEMLVPERFRGHHPALRHSFFSDPKSRPMGAGRDLFGLKRDGSEFPVEIGLNPIETDEGVMVLSAIVDLSGRKRMEERFKRVVEFAPNAMVMISDAGRIEMVNAQTEALFGYDRGELLGQPVEILVPERLRQRHPGLRQSFFGDPKSRPMGVGRDLYAVRKNGTEFPVEIGLNPIETDEGLMVLSSIMDISERKLREQVTQGALKEKDILLGEIHHRVKNNLHIIHSLLDLQSARITDTSVQEMLRESQNRIRSMALIHQTLYESKDFAGVDFGTFLDTLIPTLFSSYGVDPFRITLSILAEGVKLPINLAIPCGLMVNELVSNALKHAFPGARSGAITVTVDAAPGPEGHDDQVVLSVSDDGAGLAATVDLETTETLGLRLVQLLTDQVHGMLDIHRADPTRFTITFPLVEERKVA
jgi:PAS domain S-box-containing protein